MNFNQYRTILKNSTQSNSYSGISLTTTVNENNEEVLWIIDNRTINVPIGLHDIAIKGDSNSKKITFQTSRFFDGIDLSEKKLIVQFINASNQTGYNEIEELNIKSNVITFDWFLPSEITVQDGIVKVQIEFYDEEQKLGENQFIIYRFQTKPCEFEILPSLSVNNDAEKSDHFIEMKLLSDIKEYTNNLIDIKSDIEPIEISNRTIVMPYLQDIAISQDSNSRVLSFYINRYFDNVDLFEKTIVINYQLENGQGDCIFASNVSATPTKIYFDWLLDSKVTSIPGNVNFSIEFLSNLNNKFYCWKTLSAYITIKEGLNIYDCIEQPSPSWIQNWNIKAEQYLKEYVKFLNQIEELTDVCIDSANKAQEYSKQAESFSISSKNSADIAWKQAERAEQAKSQTEEYKKDFDKKYAEFLKEYDNIRKKDEPIEFKDLAVDVQDMLNGAGDSIIEIENLISEIQTDLNGKAEKIHIHDVSEVVNARSKLNPIDFNDLSENAKKTINNKAEKIHTHDVSEVEHARPDNVAITEDDLDKVLIEKINASNCDLDFVPEENGIEGNPPVIDPAIINYIATTVITMINENIKLDFEYDNDIVQGDPPIIDPSIISYIASQLNEKIKVDFLLEDEQIKGTLPVIDPAIINYIATEIQKSASTIINDSISANTSTYSSSKITTLLQNAITNLPHYISGTNIELKTTDNNNISINLIMPTAKNISYDNTNSHLAANNIAEAIDQIATDISKKAELLSYILETSKWSNEEPYYYLIENPKLNINKTLEIFAKDATFDQINAYKKAAIDYIEHTEGTIKLYINGEKPIINLPIGIIIRGDV